MQRTVLGLALFTSATLAHAACVPIQGTVQTMPEAAGRCTVASYYPPGTPFVGRDQCYTLVLKARGLPNAHGYAGVTVEPIASLLPNGGQALSPAAVQGRQLLTARSTFALGGTRFYLSEIIVESDGIVTEQSVITGTDGRGTYAQASGGFHVLGNSIGAAAPVRGQLCSPGAASPGDDDHDDDEDED